MSASSMDEAEFQQKTKRFLANMQVLRQEDNGMVSPLYRDEVVDELEIEEHGYEETIQMADVKWQVQAGSGGAAVNQSYSNLKMVYSSSPDNN